MQANAKGLKPGAWAWRTLLAMILCLLIGGFISSFILIAKHPELKRLAETTTDSAKLRDAMMPYFEDPVSFIFVLFCEFGGYLFVRRKLLQYPDRKSQKN
jgi:hypothetical protein